MIRPEIDTMNLSTHNFAALALGATLLFLFSACSAQNRGPAGETVELQIADTIEIQPADATAEAIVSAAKAFLATLSEAQRDTVVYAFDDNEQRARWSNFPVSFVQRGGSRRCCHWGARKLF
jgi:hypothetical protein